MKLITPKVFEYKGLNQISTTVNFVKLKDIEIFHGQEFAKKWIDFIQNKPTILIENEKCYYYIDYEFAARQTDSFLNPV